MTQLCNGMPNFTLIFECNMKMYRKSIDGVSDTLRQNLMSGTRVKSPKSQRGRCLRHRCRYQILCVEANARAMANWLVRSHAK